MIAEDTDNVLDHTINPVEGDDEAEENKIRLRTGIDVR